VACMRRRCPRRRLLGNISNDGGSEDRLAPNSIGRSRRGARSNRANDAPREQHPAFTGIIGIDGNEVSPVPASPRDADRRGAGPLRRDDRSAVSGVGTVAIVAGAMIGAIALRRRRSADSRSPDLHQTSTKGSVHEFETIIRGATEPEYIAHGDRPQALKR